MGSDRIKTLFEKKRAEQKPAFVTFVTAGHPTLDSTVDVLLAYVPNLHPVTLK
jgi:tryptophan synthase alpha subunit